MANYTRLASLLLLCATGITANSCKKAYAPIGINKPPRDVVLPSTTDFLNQNSRNPLHLTKMDELLLHGRHAICKTWTIRYPLNISTEEAWQSLPSYSFTEQEQILWRNNHMRAAIVSSEDLQNMYDKLPAPVTYLEGAMTLGNWWMGAFESPHINVKYPFNINYTLPPYALDKTPLPRYPSDRSAMLLRVDYGPLGSTQIEIMPQHRHAEAPSFNDLPNIAQIELRGTEFEELRLQADCAPGMYLVIGLDWPRERLTNTSPIANQDDMPQAPLYDLSHWGDTPAPSDSLGWWLLTGVYMGEPIQTLWVCEIGAIEEPTLQ